MTIGADDPEMAERVHAAHADEAETEAAPTVWRLPLTIRWPVRYLVALVLLVPAAVVVPYATHEFWRIVAWSWTR